MARKRIEAKLGEVDEGVVKSIVMRAEGLYRKHAGEIAKVRDESDDKKVSLTFSVLVDCSDSAPKVRTRLRYSQTVTDELIDSLEDPSQPTLFDPEVGKKDRVGRTSATEETA